MEEKQSRQDGIEKLTLALLYLTRFSDNTGFRLNEESFHAQPGNITRNRSLTTICDFRKFFGNVF